MPYTISTTRTWTITFPLNPIVTEMLDALKHLPPSATLEAMSTNTQDQRKLMFSVTNQLQPPCPGDYPDDYLATVVDY